MCLPADCAVAREVRSPENVRQLEFELALGILTGHERENVRTSLPVVVNWRSPLAGGGEDLHIYFFRCAQILPDQPAI